MAAATVHQLHPQTLTADLDALSALRARLKADEKAERELTARVLAQLDQLGVTACRTADTVARVDTVSMMSLDPGLFILACDSVDKALPALRVSVEKARDCLPGDVLQAINQPVTVRRLVVTGR